MNSLACYVIPVISDLMNFPVPCNQDPILNDDSKILEFQKIRNSGKVDVHQVPFDDGRRRKSVERRKDFFSGDDVRSESILPDNPLNVGLKSRIGI